MRPPSRSRIGWGSRGLRRSLSSARFAACLRTGRRNARNLRLNFGPSRCARRCDTSPKLTSFVSCGGEIGRRDAADFLPLLYFSRWRVGREHRRAAQRQWDARSPSTRSVSGTQSLAQNGLLCARNSAEHLQPALLIDRDSVAQRRCRRDFSGRPRRDYTGGNSRQFSGHFFVQRTMCPPRTPSSSAILRWSQPC